MEVDTSIIYVMNKVSVGGRIFTIGVVPGSRCDSTVAGLCGMASERHCWLISYMQISSAIVSGWRERSVIKGGFSVVKLI